MAAVDIGSRQLHVARRGSGDPLLLIPGLAATSGFWGEPFLDALAADREVITYDHRGIGESSPSQGAFSIADLADDAAALLEALGVASAHIAGTSMGGMVAQELALRHPGRVRTLSLICTYAGGPGSAITDRAVFGRYLSAIRSGDVEAVAQTGFEINVGPAARERPGMYRTYRTLAFAGPAPRPVVVEQARATAPHDTSARLGSVAVPTSVIHGDQDLMLDVANAHQIADLMPGAQLDVLPGAGHVLWLEQPQVLARLIAETCGRAVPA